MSLVDVSPTVEARFWSKVDASGDCWEWTAGQSNGYGIFHIRRRPVTAHRVAWSLLVGSQEGRQLDHLCRNRGCVNPDHLRLVDGRTNVLDGFGHTAVNARKSACKRGHVFDEANTYITKEGWRQCRKCQAAKQRRLKLGIRIGAAGS